MDDIKLRNHGVDRPATIDNHYHHNHLHQQYQSPIPENPMRFRRRHHSSAERLWRHYAPRFGLVGMGLLFIIYWNMPFMTDRRKQIAWGKLRGRPREKWVTKSSQPFNWNGLASATERLIVVAGHSVTIAGHLEDADRDEHDWFLMDYQRHRGLPEAIVAHIKGGLSEALRDPKALLVFSGGETRASTGPETEGASYYRVADAMDLWPTNSTVRARTITEEFATDSFENLLFSICRFKEITGKYPETITMVSFTFKQRRFENLHARALRWPTQRFSFIGIDPPTTSGFNLEEATAGEQTNAAKPFESDPYGCHSPLLLEKRRQRNPFSRTPPYQLSCPDMKELLQYCGPELIPSAMVPWTKIE